MTIAVCTLFESHYHYGVAALVNSLVSANYEGTVWVGYRGPLPKWMVQRKDFDVTSRRLQVTPNIGICAVEVNSTVSLNYCKPLLMRNILEVYDLAATSVVYFDPDLIVKCNWMLMMSWISSDGIALVEDIDWNVPFDDPKRMQWQKFFENHGESCGRRLERYYNSGFVGINRNAVPFLEKWERINMLIAVENRSALRERKSGQPGSLFHSTDEDGLNFALSLCEIPLNTEGPEAMDFVPGGHRMSHAVGAEKPWEGKHLRRALQGLPPSAASRWFYRFASGPLRPFSITMLARRRLSMTLAIALGRVWAHDKATH